MRIENSKSRTKKKTARITAGMKEKNTSGTGKAGSCDMTDDKYNEMRLTQQEQEKLDHVT